MRITRIEPESIGRVDKAHFLSAKLPVLARVERVPIELLADDVDHRGLALVRKPIYRLGPERNGEADQQDALDQRHRAFNITRSVAPDSVVIRLRIARW